jgi:lantibiotic biosynthesis protein
MFSSFSKVLIRCPLHSLQQAYDIPQTFDASFLEGLRLASPEFWEMFQKRELLTGKDKIKMDRSLAKYWIRSCCRSTPFGTFAGTTMATLNDGSTSLLLHKSDKHFRHIRLDMNYMSQIVQLLLQSPAIQEQVKLYLNNSLYDTPDGYRYAEYTLHESIRYYHLASLQKTDYLEAVFTMARQGVYRKTLVNMLVDAAEVLPEEATAFIDELCNASLLVADLELTVTGAEPIDQLLKKLKALQGVEEPVAILETVKQLTANPQAGVSVYEKIEQALQPFNISSRQSRDIFQTDMYLAVQSSVINRELIQAVVHQVQDLIFLAREHRSPLLEEFIPRFIARYETREVPLSIALDPDLGVGYGPSDIGGDQLLAGIEWPTGKTAGRREDYIRRYAYEKYLQFVQEQKDIIEITEEELKEKKDEVQHLEFPNSMFLVGSLLKKNGTLNPQHFSFHLSKFGGPSGALYLGRFTQGNEGISSLARETLDQERLSDEDAIYAEVAHLPQARLGNVLLRAVLLPFEIPYVGRSGAAEDCQLPVDDLVVSVRNNRVVLRSKKHGKRVVPRLTCAHNFRIASLPVYRFLCELQFHGYAQPNVWDWGWLGEKPYLPRVVYKNIIIEKARWLISTDDTAPLPNEKTANYYWANMLRQKYRLPRYVTAGPGDQELLIDLDNETGIDLLVQFLKKNKKLLLYEYLSSAENCIVSDNSGKQYAHEMVIPLFKTTPQKKYSDETAGTSLLQRKFICASEWLYCKIYCGTKSAASLLTDVILPFVEEGLRAGSFEKFFFIRYHDDFPHIRIRFFNTDTKRQTRLQEDFMRLLQPSVAAGKIDKIVIDTYSREIERYGEDLMLYAESLFFADSLAVLRLLPVTGDNEQQRLLMALCGIHLLLEDFNFSLSEKKAFAVLLQARFKNEFGNTRSLDKQLNDKYRQYQKQIFTFFDCLTDTSSLQQPGVAVLLNRSVMHRRMMEPVRDILFDPARRDRLTEFAANHIHMFVNRLFNTNQRKYELLLYHFLSGYYTSFSIKQKGSG